MVDKERLIQRYTDLFEPETDAEMLQVAAMLDEAVRDYRQLDVPARLDRAVEALSKQRRAPAVNGKLPESVEAKTSTAPGTLSRLPTKLRTGWFGQGIGMAAAAAVLILVGGILAVTFHSQGGSQRGGFGGSVTDTVSEPAFVSLQSEAGFQLYAPTWLPKGWTRLPLTHPSNISAVTEVVIKYTGPGQSQTLGIFEYSPYQLSASSFPQSLYDRSVEVDLGNGITARVAQVGESVRLWWQAGSVAIQFSTGLTGPQAPPTRIITQDEVLRIAKSMAPVAKAPTQPTTTSSATLPMTTTANGAVVTSDSIAIDEARGLDAVD